MNRIFNKNEFAPLKKVVVTQSEFVIPEELVDTDFLPEVDMEQFKKEAGRLYADVYPEAQKEWEQERENLIHILEQYGVEVLRPRKLTDYEKTRNRKDGCSNFFVRDPFFTVGNYLIEGNLRFKHRRNEILPVRDLLTEQAYRSDAVYISIPKPDISEGEDSEKGPFLEGGDVLVYNEYVFVGKSGLASNDAGYLWLKHLLEPQGYHVIQVPLLSDVLHLDCALSLVRDGLMIVSEKALLNGIPRPLKNWDKIVVEPEMIKYLAVNGLPINEDTYLTDVEFRESIGKELEERGITVHYIDFKISRSMGGSFRCSTQALLRE